jgi:undecaprenyl diphosphate synthase
MLVRSKAWRTRRNIFLKNNFMDNLKHIGFIMDGNRRWAREKGLPTLEGHRAGYDLVKKIGPWCLARGVKFVTLFAFSTENWKRTQDEVGYLMDLLMSAVTRDLEFFMKDNFRLKVIGRRSDLSEKLQQAIAEAEEKTRNNTAGTMQLAISYGGRDEIVRAAQKAAISFCHSRESGNPETAITEEAISNHLDTDGIPDPDLIIRTSGEQRLSGFLLWQSAYSELLFLEKHWPDFNESDLDAAIDWYANRERRYGK